MIPAELLVHVPGCEEGRPPLAVHALPGGRGCNQILRVDTTQGRFVWRRRLPPIDRAGARPIDELRAQRRAAAAGLAPAVLVAHPEGHWLLMDYIDAPVWTREQLHSEAGAVALAGQLARLHALPVPAELPVVDVPAMARDYLGRLAAVDAAEATELAPLGERIAALSARLSAMALRPALNHGDLMASNMLGKAPLLVDWEYAQATDPTWDLACLLTYYPGMARFMDQLLAGTGLAGTAAAAGLELQRERFELVNRLWERLAAHGSG
jgi:aminoglycoside phosphotransferase (APT) family kinase protein